MAHLDDVNDCQSAAIRLVVSTVPWILFVGWLTGLARGLHRSWSRSRIRSLGAAVGVTLAFVFVLGLSLGRGIQPRARISKAQADVNALASAVEEYRRHMNRLPPALTNLTKPATNGRGMTAGPLTVIVPFPPVGWDAYRYEVRPDGSFAISSQGDCQAVNLSRLPS